MATADHHDPIPHNPALASMCYRTLLTGCFTILAAASLGWAGTTGSTDKPFCWEALAEGMGKQDTGQGVVSPSVAAQGDKHLWLAWSEGASVQVRRWNGRRWERVPGPPEGTTGAYDPVIRLAPSGVPVLAWRASEGSQSNVYVGSWDGNSWKLMGNPLSAFPESFTNAGDAAMVLDDSGYPIVTWQEAKGIGPRSLHAARWKGKAWVRLGEAVSTGSDLYSLEPSLALDDQGSVWLAWNGGTKARSFIRVARWDGAAWQDVGNTESGLLHRRDEVGAPQLVLRPANQAFLAWFERGREFSSLELARWKGMGWEPVSPPPAVPGTTHRSESPSLLVTEDGTPLLAWAEEDASDFFSAHVQQLTATGWQSVLTRMHLDPGQSDVNDVKIIAGPHSGFYMTWDEPDDSGQRVRTIRVTPCPSGTSPTAPPPLRPRASFWPKTVDAAVDDVLSKLSPESKAQVRSTRREDLVKFHHRWGTGIRNSYGLWRGNTSLLESCGGKDVHPDHCSMVIIERVWERLQQPPPGTKG